jgi:hypothetical protein
MTKIDRFSEVSNTFHNMMINPHNYEWYNSYTNSIKNANKTLILATDGAKKIMNNSDNTSPIVSVDEDTLPNMIDEESVKTINKLSKYINGDSIPEDSSNYSHNNSMPRVNKYKNIRKKICKKFKSRNKIQGNTITNNILRSTNSNNIFNNNNVPTYSNSNLIDSEITDSTNNNTISNCNNLSGSSSNQAQYNDPVSNAISPNSLCNISINNTNLTDISDANSSNSNTNTDSSNSNTNTDSSNSNTNTNLNIILIIVGIFIIIVMLIILAIFVLRA